jgi:hypothetical protein
MTKSDLYLELLPKLAAYLNGAGRMTAAELTDFNEDMSFNKYPQACDKLLNLANIGPYRKVAQYLKDGLADTSDLTVALPLRKREVSIDENKKRLADISYYNNHRAVITAKAISAMMTQPDDADYDSRRFHVIEMIWLKQKDTVADLQHLWETMDGQHQVEYYIFTNDADDAETDWRQYAYCYLCYVNERSFKRPSVLSYTASLPYATSITYEAGNKYEQYFDAYNVMNESKYADDILLRYLRMYQVLEYFGYRRILADVTKGNIRENGFVRNVISKTNGRTNNESNEIKKGISDLLPNLATSGATAGVFDSADITPAMVTFIKDKLLLPKYQFDDGHLWDVIYKLRNCIVHNKESELHFTYANTDVYADGIDLMRKIVEKMEPEIVKVINDPAITGLEFSKQFEAMF